MAMHHLGFTVGLLVVATGCSEPGGSRASSSPTAPMPPTSMAAPADPVPAARDARTLRVPSSSAQVAVPSRVTHLRGAPPAMNERCEDPPKGNDRWGVVAVAVKRLACEPGLYFRPTADVARELALPDGVTFSFPAATGAEIRLSDEVRGGRAEEVAAALGIATPVVTPGRSGAWALRQWRLGSNPTSGELDRWSPGIITIGVKTDAEPSAGLETVAPLGRDDTLRGSIVVTMPTLTVVHDEVALAMLVRSLDIFAADGGLSARPPPEVARKAKLANERFRVSRRSMGTGATAIHRVDVWTARTFIAAPALLEALGLEGEITPERARDSNDYVLRNGPRDEHVVNGVRLHLRFAPNRDAGRAAGNDGF
ncbi:MAG: hypothetical protein AAF928_03550, partial [Myxococcota bacterium]